MEGKTIIATLAADTIIILGDTNRVNLRVNSAILCNASEKFNDLFGRTTNDKSSQNNSEDLPEITLPEEDVTAAAAMICFLHHHYDLSEKPDCETVLDIAMLADDYKILPSIESHLESLIHDRASTCEIGEDLCFLLLAASTIRARNAFRIVSAKLVRVGPATSFQSQFYRCFGIRDFAPEITTGLEAKRVQIENKVVDCLSPVLKPCRCECMEDESNVLEIVRTEVKYCMDVKERRTPEERLVQMDSARYEVGNWVPCALPPGSDIECVVPLAMRCLAYAIQDVKSICHEGLSLADIEKEQAKNS